MISVVLIGRNDGHGYNLSKRVANSMNNISLFMADSDEIVFVDWNTDDFTPSFIEAISDTLTQKTKEHLVVFRVRNSIHNKLRQSSSTPILEPIARNVGIRRAKNEWILSTNTDMLFNLYTKNFQQILKELDFGLYHLYRYEIPEYVWDKFDRNDPENTIMKIRAIGANGDLLRRINSKPYPKSKNYFPDGVGDFQLATKSLWYSVKGFPEDMLKGWHVDARLSAIMEIENSINSKILDNELVQGFHQNHLRIQTHFHSSKETNPIELVGKNYENSNDWGLADYEIESIRFPLESTFRMKKSELSNIATIEEVCNSITYKQALVDFFIQNEFDSLNRTTRMLVSSANCLEQKLLGSGKDFFTGTRRMQFVGAVSAQSNERIQVAVLDFGILDESLEANLVNFDFSAYLTTIQSNVEILARLQQNTRVICIRTNHWALRSIVREFCSSPLMNNYSLIFSGNIKKANDKFRYFKLFKVYLLLNLFVADLKNTEYFPKNFNHKFIKKTFFARIILKTYFLLPFVFRRVIRKFFIKFLDII